MKREPTHDWWVAPKPCPFPAVKNFFEACAVAGQLAVVWYSSQPYTWDITDPDTWDTRASQKSFTEKKIKDLFERVRKSRTMVLSPKEYAQLSKAFCSQRQRYVRGQYVPSVSTLDTATGKELDEIALRVGIKREPGIPTIVSPEIDAVLRKRVQAARQAQKAMNFNHMYGSNPSSLSKPQALKPFFKAILEPNLRQIPSGLPPRQAMNYVVQSKAAENTFVEIKPGDPIGEIKPGEHLHVQVVEDSSVPLEEAAVISSKGAALIKNLCPDACTCGHKDISHNTSTGVRGCSLCDCPMFSPKVS